MKNLYLLGFIIITIFFASCGSEKTVVSQEPQQPITQQPVKQQPIRESVVIPCKNEAKSDKDYFRLLGTGTSIRMEDAMRVALYDAKNKLQNTTDNLLIEISRCSLYDINLGDYIKDMSSHIYYDMNVVCDDTYVEATGHYHSYCAIEVSKKQIKTCIINDLNKLSKDNDLGIDFNEDIFVNYLNNIMNIE